MRDCAVCHAPNATVERSFPADRERWYPVCDDCDDTIDRDMPRSLTAARLARCPADIAARAPLGI